MNGSIKLPIYAKIAFILIGLYLLIDICYIGQQIILPFMYAALFSILVTPLITYLQRKKVKRIFAITIAMLLAIIVTIGLFYLITSQLSIFEKSMPAMKQKSNELMVQGSSWEMCIRDRKKLMHGL